MTKNDLVLHVPGSRLPSAAGAEDCITQFTSLIHTLSVCTNQVYAQVYVPTSSYDESEVDEFYRELQSLVDQTLKQDILVVQGDWNAKVGEDAQEDRGEVCGQPSAGKHPKQP